MLHLQPDLLAPVRFRFRTSIAGNRTLSRECTRWKRFASSFREQPITLLLDLPFLLLFLCRDVLVFVAVTLVALALIFAIARSAHSFTPASVAG